jgi:secondary thiamine-phosphate synthase enzyme
MFAGRVQRGGTDMKSHTEYLTFHLPARMAFLNITPQVEESVRKSGVAEGLVLVNAMHITASVFINDDEPGLHADYAKWLEQLAPFDPSPARYAHNRTGEDNADAHLKRQVMGREVVVAITKGSSTSARGSKSSTASSTATDRSACWSR